MKQLFALLVVLCTLMHSIAQENPSYSELSMKAYEQYSNKDYQESATTYTKAFQLFRSESTTSDRYNAACSWALSGNIDSSFAQLFIIASNGSWTYYSHTINDGDLNSLHSDPRWEQVLALIKAFKEKEEENLDKPLVRLLEGIYEEDQKYRQQIDAIVEEHGWESEAIQNHWKIINSKDSINLIKIRKILDERGWLGADIVGKQGNSTLFLVIQHANLEVQQEYLPMMREAVKAGNARSGSLALLEDRVALRQGGKQIYGSQVARDPESGEHYLLPLIDPDNIDVRRAEVGLQPIQGYISNWGMTWDAEEYKKMLPEIEARQKKR